MIHSVPSRGRSGSTALAETRHQNRLPVLALELRLGAKGFTFGKHRAGHAAERGIRLLVLVKDQGRLAEKILQRIAEHLGTQAVGLRQLAIVGEQDADGRVLEDRVEFQRRLLRCRDHRRAIHCCRAASSTRSSEAVSCLPQPSAISALSCCQTAAATGSGAPMRRRLVHQQRVILVVQARLDAGGKIPARHAPTEDVQHARSRPSRPAWPRAPD
jgi:hypothetical protein